MGEKRVVAFASIVYTRTLHYYNNYTALITPLKRIYVRENSINTTTPIFIPGFSMAEPPMETLNKNNLENIFVAII